MLFGNNSSSQTEKRRVVCVFCGHVHYLSKLSVSAACQHCRKTMKLDDIRIKDFQSRRVIDTCETFIVEGGAKLQAEKVFCNVAILFGRSKTEIVSRGNVIIGGTAIMHGDITAPSMKIDDGAVIEGFFRVGPAHAQADPKPAPEEAKVA